MNQSVSRKAALTAYADAETILKQASSKEVTQEQDVDILP